ncbi:hypothetical protein H0H92_016076 [Tricholoma furcatifolium]|nr:hypothetical protein H0H92_016076 [Tricholoma furcatifolium]
MAAEQLFICLQNQENDYNEKVLNTHKNALGDSHLETIDAMENLAATYLAAKQPKQAQELYEQALNARKELFGNMHPETINAMENLAATLHAAKQPKQAQELYEQALNARKELFGNMHPETIKAMKNLAAIPHGTEGLKQAQELPKKVLNTHKEAFSNDHSKALDIATSSMSSVTINVDPTTSFLVPELAQNHAENIETIIHKILLYAGYQGFNPETVHCSAPEQEIHIVLEKNITFGLRVALAKIAQPFAGNIIILEDTAIQKSDARKVEGSVDQNSQITDNEDFGIEKANTSIKKDEDENKEQNDQQREDGSDNHNNNKNEDEPPSENPENNDNNKNNSKESDSDNESSENKSKQQKYRKY